MHTSLALVLASVHAIAALVLKDGVVSSSQSKTKDTH